MGLSKKKAEYYREQFNNLSVKIPWRYFVYVLRKHYGFQIYSRGRTSGAQRAFFNGEIRFSAHEPHGGDDYVDKVSRQNAVRAIEMLEATNKRR